jgi:hypothetical protein
MYLSVINNEIQSTCVPNQKQKEKEDIIVVNDDLDTDKYINDNTESDHKVTLSENDHQDLVEIFKNRFPDCSTKMSIFLLSQKMALERHPFGKRWDKDIVRMCLKVLKVVLLLMRCPYSQTFSLKNEKGLYN